LPQGSFPLLPTLLTTMGWISSLFQDDCDFVHVDGDVVQHLATSSETPWIEAGIKAYREPNLNTKTGEWKVDYDRNCLMYPSEYVNTDEGSWKMSKACSFLALVLGGGGTLFLWFSTCCTFSKGSWRWAGYEIFFASIFQALSFVFFRTELCQQNKCNLFWGARTDIMATILWFLASLCIFCYYPKPQDVDDYEPDGVMIDGSRVDELVPPMTHDLSLRVEDKIQATDENSIYHVEQPAMASGEHSGQEDPAII